MVKPKKKETPKYRGKFPSRSTGKLAEQQRKSEKKRAKGQHTPAAARNPPDTRPGGSSGSSHHYQKLGKWSKEQMIQAWNDHQAGCSISASARQNGVPITTAKDKFRAAKKLISKQKPYMQIFGHCSGGKSKPRLFTMHEEMLLADHLEKMAEGGCGLTCAEFRSLAYSWAEENQIPVTQTSDEHMSYTWYYGFLSRYPSLKVIKPEELSIYRAIAPSQEGVDAWFDNLENLSQKYKITDPNQIWNIDETGIQDQPKAQRLIIPLHAPKFQLVAGERAQLTTVLCAANAAGVTAHPTVIMKGKNVLQSWREYKPDNWNLFCSDNGWITKEIFLRTGRKFLKFLESQGWLGRHQLLLMDGHSSHAYNFAFVQLMAAHNVTVVLFPPHCTHFMQPYDSVMLAMLKRNWQDCMRIWNRRHGGVKLGKASFFIPFRRAWNKSMTPNYIQAAFRKTGIWPLDRSKINQSWFKAKEALG